MLVLELHLFISMQHIIFHPLHFHILYVILLIFDHSRNCRICLQVFQVQLVLMIICVLDLMQLIKKLLSSLLILINLIQLRLRKSLILVFFHSLLDLSLPRLHQQHLRVIRFLLV